jgi:transposase
MAGVLKITISESTKDLKQLLHQQSSARLKERLQALYWLRSGKVKTRQNLARVLARGESTVYRWLKLYKQGGLRGLLEVKPASGRAPKLQGQALERLKQRLAEPEGFNSYGAVSKANLCQP